MASSEEASIATSVKKLRGAENFSAWQMDIEVTLLSLRLKKIVDGNIPRPSTPAGAVEETDEHYEWDNKNIKATRILVNSITERMT